MLFYYLRIINSVVPFDRGGDEGLRREPRGVGRRGQPQGAPVPAEAHVVNELWTLLRSKIFYSYRERDIRTGCSSEEDYVARQHCECGVS